MYKPNILNVLFFVIVFYGLSSVNVDASCNNIDFVANKTEGCEQELFRFIAQNVPPNSTLRWDFGNGVITTNQDTIFRLYTSTGSYNVSLRVTLSGGQVCNDVIKPNFINIGSIPDPIIDISDPLLCDGPGSVTFTDMTANSVSRDWIIDGQLYPNANQQVVHTFTSLGDKNVTLRVTNTDGCTNTKTIMGAVKISSSPTLNVCATITQKTDETTANFNISSGGLGSRTITGYEWSFPGGSPTSSTISNPTVVYSDIYNGAPQTVSVIVTLSDGCKIERTYTNSMRKYINISDASPCIKQKLTLSNNSTGEGRTNFQWNFIGAVIIDGNATTGYNILYGQPGKYNVNFSFRHSSTGCLWNVSLPEIITVNPPRASMSVPFSDRISCDDTLTVNLVSNSDLPATGTNTYTWNIYDTTGNLMPNTPIGPSNNNTAKYLFPKGVFDVELIVQNTNGCVDTAYRQSYVIVGSPEVDFKLDKGTNVYCIDETVIILNETKPRGSGDLRDTYSWRISHRDSFNIFFESGVWDFYFFPKQIGYYNVRLIVENVIGCIDTKEVKEMFFVQGVQAVIITDSNEGCPIMSTGLKAKVYGKHPPNSNLTYKWHVNDETTSGDFIFSDPESDSTQFQILTAGCFNPGVKINNVVCELSLLKFNICAGVIANFGYEGAICKKTNIQLVDSSQLQPATYKWSVSPSTASFYPSDTDSAPQIYLPDDGTYEVTLIVTNQRGVSTCADTIVRLLTTQSPSVDFEVDNDYHECAPVIVNFTNKSVNAVDYIWHFGDGQILESNLVNLSHTYAINNPLGFNVTLVAVDADGCHDTLTKLGLIEVIGPVPEFKSHYIAACDSALVEFEDKSQFVVSYLFDYGDGTSADSNAMNTHLYKIRDDAEGDTIIYLPTLIVKDEFDCIAFFRDTIMLFNTPMIDFDANLSGGCVPEVITFNSTSEYAYELLWDFTNNGIIDDTVDNPVYTYLDTGKFDVVLIGIGAGNCSDTLVKQEYIEIVPKPEAKLQVNQAGFICGDKDVIPENLSLYFDSFIIDYGVDGLKDTNVISEVTYSYDFAGGEDSVLFFPSITVFNQYGCFDEYTDTLILYRPVEAGMYFEDENTCENVIVEFTDVSSGASNWQWDFTGDNIINSTQQNPNFIFNPGSYFVKLIAGNRFGCYDTVVSDTPIEVMPIPEAEFMFSDSSICPEDEVSFTDSSTGQYQLINWQWNFGNVHNPDNNNWTGQNPPPHAYFVPGYYSVTLIVTDENSCNDTLFKEDIIYVQDSTSPNAPNINYVSMVDNYISGIYWNKNPYLGFRENRLYLRRHQVFEDSLLFTSNKALDTTFVHDFIPPERPLCYYLITEKQCNLLSEPSVMHCAMHLQANSLTSSSNIVSWTPYVGWGNQLEGYEIYYKINNQSDFEFLAEILAADTSFIHEDLCDFEYCYYVKAIHSSELFTSVSNTACNRPPYQYQTYPLTLYKSTVLNNQDVFTVWEAGVQPNINKYIIDRMDTSRIWEIDYAETLAEETFFIDKKAFVHDQFYTYRVRVEDVCGNTSPNSNIGRSVLLTTQVTEDIIQLKWNAYREWPGDVHRYLIELYDNNTREFNEIAQVVGAAREYTDLDVYPEIDSSYCYRVTAIENSPEPDSSVSNISCALLNSRVFIPNAFSPDGNHINEVFKVQSLSIYNQIGDPLREFQLKIYDRWGSKIFETNDIYEGWDGSTIKGQNASAGVYVYVIRAVGVDGITFNVSGTLTLVR